MVLIEQSKADIIEQFGKTTSDTGCTEVQVALLTAKIEKLQSHFKDNPKDHHSRRGLINMVNKRRNLLNYLLSKFPERYRAVIKSLGLRR